MIFQPKISNSSYVIRNYHSEDFDKLVRLVTEVQDLAQTCCLISPLDLIEIVGQPNNSFRDNLFLVERVGEIVGFAEVRPELTIGRVVLRWLLHPKHCRGGLVAKLVDHAIARTKELGIVTIHLNISQDSPMAKRLLAKIGFIFVRRFLELRLHLSEAHLPEVSMIAPQYRPLQPGEEERLTQLQNRSFTGSWGYNANTVKEMTFRINLPNCSHQDIILTFDLDKPVGFCWTRIDFRKNKTLGEGIGRIYMLGVDPDYRRRGLDRQLLLLGLSYLKSKDIRVVELTVDTENKVARTLYKSVGFKLWKSSLWYEKRLD